ncbi:MAG: TatD family hydrolase [Nitrospirae bacterium]|nr:TatD family hydrolase [Nitrospirota bacterium]
MPVYDTDRDDVIHRAKAAGIVAMIAVGAHPEECLRTVGLAQDHDFIYASVGIHPHDVKEVGKEETDRLYQSLEELARSKKVIAWGETGLDYYYEHSPREIQKEHFRRQIAMAKRLHLPLIVHSRDAAEDTLSLLWEEKAGELGGVFHCFSGDMDMARQVLDLGFFISFSGVITFKNAGKLTDVVKTVPMDRILVETDCPYLTPTPYRGKRNEPSYVRYVVDKVAEVRGMTPADVAGITMANACRLFGIRL